MTERRIKTELITYDHQKLIHASGRLLHMFAAYSDIPKTFHWTGSLPYLHQVITNAEETEMLWNAEGIALFFSGFKAPKLKIIEENGTQKLLSKTPDPYFAVWERPDEVLPSQRNHYYAVTNSIFEEMRETYQVNVDSNPPSISFPADVYAKKIIQEEVILFSK